MYTKYTGKHASGYSPDIPIKFRDIWVAGTCDPVDIIMKLKHQHLARLCLAAAFCLLFVACGSGDLSEKQSDTRPLPEKVTFNKNIRPIFSRICFTCHGPDAAHNPSKLRLDVRELALSPLEDHPDLVAIKPFKPEESEVVRRTQSEDPNVEMPPPDFKHRLTGREKKLLEKWIAQGAEYQQHWAFMPVSRPKVPATSDESHNAIDQFVDKELAARGLHRSKPEEDVTLLRRLSFDLTGLPPSPEDVAQYREQPAAQAYDSQVDRLLDSPQYGERMAVFWLDLVRYADTEGYHGDGSWYASPYRDYVINAFNTNKPFSQFTVEQIAGDLLPGVTDEIRAATCYNRLNMVTRENGAQAKEYLVKYMDDRVRTLGTAWLGVTIGCAQCHDHKFDPFTQKDFYRLGAFFADIDEVGVYDTNYAPTMFVADLTYPEKAQEIQQLEGELKGLREDLLAAPYDTDEQAAMGEWRAALRRYLAAQPGIWRAVEPLDIQSQKGTEFTLLNDRSILTENSQPYDVYTVRFKPQPGTIQAIRVEVLPRESFGGNLSAQGGVILQNVGLERQEGDAAPVPLDLDWYRVSHGEPFEALLPPRTVMDQKGWSVRDPAQSARAQELLLTPEMPLHIDKDSTVSLKLDFTRPYSDGYNFGRFRVSTTPLPKAVVQHGEDLAAFTDTLNRRNEELDDAQRSNLENDYRLTADRYTGQQLKIAELEKTLHEKRALSKNPVMITRSVEPRTVRVLHRGNWMDESGEVVDPGVPSLFPQIATSAGQRASRLDLANWLVSASNPLTARVFVNRLWALFFGAGLSPALDDFGSQGQYPSDPELLDWLAAEFVDSGWDVKHMVRLIVTSQTYRQASRAADDGDTANPDNRFLAHQNIRRLEAEFVRDNALAVSGLLDTDLGGPSVFPYQPAGYFDQLSFPTRKYKASLDGSQYRRGLYTHWQRTLLHPALQAFDAPSREQCTASRTVSNTPMQAMTLLNDPSFVEAARALAARVVDGSGAGDFPGKLEWLFEQVLNRDYSPPEMEKLQPFYETEFTRFSKDRKAANRFLSVGLAPVPARDDPAELAAWTSVSRVLLNLHESLSIY